MIARRALGALALAVALASLLAFAIAGWALSLPSLIATLATASALLPTGGVLVFMVLLAGSSLWLALRARKLPRGTEGRLRLLLLAWGACSLALASAAAIALLLVIANKLPAGAPLSLEDASYLLPSELRAALF
ncbi:MAG TPA: hypothetical protein VFX59_15550, partial [Polyangiales bacterium]|nr:hypothetical protein [Polyangiales bacterium]